MTDHLDALQRAYLVTLVNTDGFKVLQDIMEGEVEKFRTALLNTDPSNEKAVLAAHTLAKAAAQFYAGLINRINGEIEIYTNAPKASDKPLDITENLDLDLQSITAALPNLLEDRF